MASLPIASHREAIEALAREHRVVAIQGETGCGKSTQVPRYLYELMKEEQGGNGRVVVTQPRRIAAVTLARRVADEFGERVGETAGYRIQHDSSVSSRTRIEFVTTGWLLVQLSHDPTQISRYSYIVLDETHERSLDGDLLALLLKLLLSPSDANGPSPYASVKLVLMSATLQSELFLNYFSFLISPEYIAAQAALPTRKKTHRKRRLAIEANYLGPPPLFVGARRFPVKDIFLNEFHSHVQLTTGATSTASDVSSRMGVCRADAVRAPSGNAYADEQLRRNQSAIQHRIAQFNVSDDADDGLAETLGADESAENPLDLLVKPYFDEKLAELIVSLIASNTRPGEAILVFLPGINEIYMVHDLLSELPASLGEYQVLVLHSLMTREEQELAFVEHKDITKVVLSTNIAESSVTIPDATIVIDSGLKRSLSFNDHKHIQQLQLGWVSQASVKQRSGRAGRVRPGVCYHLFTKDLLTAMRKYDPPEILCTSLENTVLHTKSMLGSFGDVESLLARALQPPPPLRVKKSIQRLKEIGALQPDGDITRFGMWAATQAIDVALSKLVFMGVSFGCAADAIVMAAALSSQDPFSMPSRLFKVDENEYHRDLAASVKNREFFDAGTFSQPIGVRNMFIAYLKERGNHQFCASHSVNYRRLLNVELMSGRLAQELLHAGEGCSPKADTLAHHQLTMMSRLSHYGSHFTPANVDYIFSAPYDRLLFAITAAFSPQFLVGARGSRTQGKTGGRLLPQLDMLGYTPSRSLVLTKAPTELIQDYAMLSDCLDKFGKVVRFNVLSPSTSSAIAVEFGTDPGEGSEEEREEDEEEEEEEKEKEDVRPEHLGASKKEKRQLAKKVATKKATKRKEGEKARRTAAEKTDDLGLPVLKLLPVVRRAPWAIRLLIQLSGPNGHRLQMAQPSAMQSSDPAGVAAATHAAKSRTQHGNFRGRRGEKGPLKFGGGIVSSCVFSWTVAPSAASSIGGSKAQLPWRSVPGCITSMDESCHEIYALAYMLQGTDNDNMVTAEGITVLPSPKDFPFAQLMRLLFTRGSERMLSVTGNQDFTQISGVNVDGQAISFFPVMLHIDDFSLIDEIRHRLSRALLGHDNPFDVYPLLNITQLIHTIRRRHQRYLDECLPVDAQVTLPKSKVQTKKKSNKGGSRMGALLESMSFGGSVAHAYDRLMSAMSAVVDDDEYDEDDDFFDEYDEFGMRRGDDDDYTDDDEYNDEEDWEDDDEEEEEEEDKTPVVMPKLHPLHPQFRMTLQTRHFAAPSSMQQTSVDETFSPFLLKDRVSQATKRASDTSVEEDGDIKRLREQLRVTMLEPSERPVVVNGDDGYRAKVTPSKSKFNGKKPLNANSKAFHPTAVLRREAGGGIANKGVKGANTNPTTSATATVTTTTNAAGSSVAAEFTSFLANHVAEAPQRMSKLEAYAMACDARFSALLRDAGGLERFVSSVGVQLIVPFTFKGEQWLTKAAPRATATTATTTTATVAKTTAAKTTAAKTTAATPPVTLQHALPPHSSASFAFGNTAAFPSSSLSSLTAQLTTPPSPSVFNLGGGDALLFAATPVFSVGKSDPVPSSTSGRRGPKPRRLKASVQTHGQS